MTRNQLLRKISEEKELLRITLIRQIEDAIINSVSHGCPMTVKFEASQIKLVDHLIQAYNFEMPEVILARSGSGCVINVTPVIKED